MMYELHITVDHEAPGFYLADWIGFCNRHAIKPLDIRLDSSHAKRPRQVMFAVVAEHGGPTSFAYVWRNEWEAAVLSSGFKILRSKVEVPLDKSAGIEAVYHECHVKALIPADAVPAVVDEARDIGWLASWNNLFPDDAGLEKWYFTLRNKHDDFKRAGHGFAQAYGHIASFNWHTVRMEKETVIYDSNPALDEGWA
jgi:hypothetical protein